MRRLPHALGIAWKRSWKDLILFAIPFLCALGCLIWLEGFGSSTDWYTQHIAIADDFRSFFYRTHRLFPRHLKTLLQKKKTQYHRFSYEGKEADCYWFSAEDENGVKTQLGIPICRERKKDL